MKSARPQRLSVTRLSIAKSGYLPRESEDAIRYRAAAGRFAISDGATESSYSRAWAQLLASSYVSAVAGSGIPDLTEARRRWAQSLEGLDLPWYAQEKLERGAFATLLGLQVDVDERTWTAHAVGDSCLFQVRQQKVIVSFPVVASTDFDTHPDLISSLAWAGAPERGDTTVDAGAWEPGDTFVIATDAVSAFVVERCVEGDEVITDALGLSLTPSARRQRLVGLRKSGAIHDDDLTYAVIQTP